MVQPSMLCFLLRSSAGERWLGDYEGASAEANATLLIDYKLSAFRCLLLKFMCNCQLIKFIAAVFLSLIPPFFFTTIIHYLVLSEWPWHQARSHGGVSEPRRSVPNAWSRHFNAHHDPRRTGAYNKAVRAHRRYRGVNSGHWDVAVRATPQ